MKEFDSQPSKEFGDAEPWTDFSPGSSCSKAFEVLSAALKEVIADVHNPHLQRRTVSLELEAAQ